MLKSKQHVKLIIGTSVGVFLMAVGLATGAYLAKNSADVRNQAWGGNNYKQNKSEQQQLASQRAQEIQRRAEARVKSIDGKKMGNNGSSPEYIGPPIKVDNPRDYIVGTCNYKTFKNSCKNGKLDACVPTGKRINVRCADFDATCGVIPVGRNAGKAVCIPNNMPEIPSLPTPNNGSDNGQGYYWGGNNTGHDWPNVKYPPVDRIPTISPVRGIPTTGPMYY